MQLFIIEKPHSLIDVITNSSTELFITDGTKTVDAIKEILVGFDISGIGKVYEVTDENVLEFFEDYYIYYMDFIKDIPHFMDYYDMRQEEEKNWDVKWSSNMTETDKNKLKGYEKACKRLWQQYKNNYIVTNIAAIKAALVGKIIIEGTEDNSIDWDEVEFIESTFSAMRFHLG